MTVMQDQHSSRWNTAEPVDNVEGDMTLSSAGGNTPVEEKANEPIPEEAGEAGTQLAPATEGGAATAGGSDSTAGTPANAQQQQSEQQQQSQQQSSGNEPEVVAGAVSEVPGNDGKTQES